MTKEAEKKQKKKVREKKRKNTTGIKRIFSGVIKAAVWLTILGIFVLLATNVYVMASVSSRILSSEEAAALGGASEPPDCIEVLGASIQDGWPGRMLARRMDTAIGLYGAGTSKVILLSGDNGTNEYNEVMAMRAYALEEGRIAGVSEDCLYLDYAGFSTYESMYRLRDVFLADKAVVVTQEYHLYRALYIAKNLGIDVYGVASEGLSEGQFSRDIREIFARTKDFFFVLFDVQPTYLGDAVPLTVPSTQR